MTAPFEPYRVTEKQKAFARAFVALQAGPKHGDATKAILSCGYAGTLAGARQRAFQHLHNPAVLAEIGRCWVEANFAYQIPRKPLQCMECGGSFSADSRVKFCSAACRRAGINRRVRLHFEELTCRRCGSSFVGKKDRLYCSADCAAETAAYKNRNRAIASGTSASQKKAWAERSTRYRQRNSAAFKALKELGIEV